jgi:ubiquinone biosynthesis accessory factor UbiK
MLNQKLLDEISTKINELVAQSPVKDVEQNMRILLSGVFTKLDLVTRDEFNVQQEMLIRTREKLTDLESIVTELENKLVTKQEDNSKVSKTKSPKKT